MIHTKCSHCEEEYDLADELLGRKAKCKVCKETFEIVDSSLEKTTSDSQQGGFNPLKKTFEKSPDLELKPNKMSFIIYNSPLIIILSVIAIIGAIFSVYSLGLFILVLLIFVWENIKYKKEKYILTDRKIIFHNGSLISDNSTEINLDKITEVKASLPFLQHLIFKTGNLYIQTAGAGTAKIRLSNIENTLEVYEEFRLRMQKNGFHLQKEKLVQSEKPHILGVIGEVFGKSTGVLFAFAYMYFSFSEKIGDEAFVQNILNIFPIIVIIFLLGYLIISYLDLRKRKYDIYADSIWYSEGFLSKHFAFIPMEVVADVENTQSFFSKIFGLHDIVISSAGASNKVVFKNMVNGETMIKNLRYLKDHIVMSEKDAIEGEQKTANSLIGFKDKIEEPLDFDQEFEAHFKMNLAKTFFETFGLAIIFIPVLFFQPEAFFGVIVFFISISIGKLIKLFFTDYNIRKTAVEMKFELFSTKFNSFSIEKITGVQFKQSFIDKWFGTMTVKFWSIGSGTPITFENIKKTSGLEEQILAKIGIRKEEKQSDIETNFSFTNFLKANIWASLFMLILFPITILVYIYKKIFFAEKRYLREIYNNYIKTQNGIFFITKKYVLFRHIKGIKSTKFPLTNTGKLWLNVAGEVQIETQNSKGVKSLSILSNSVDIDYIADVFENHNRLDSVLNKKEINTEILTEAKQDIGNTIFIMFVTIIPIIFIPLAIWLIKVKYWNFEKDRVLHGSGIIYKKRQSILYKRFNFIDLKRGFLNKMFKNGSVNIYTLGSSNVDMTVSDIDNYSEIYDLLKKD